MNKLYWIVCEERERTLYEGRFVGRTRGAALKHLKEQIGRSNLTGLVFAITEIPVPLIREIVAQVLAGKTGEVATLTETKPLAPDVVEKPIRFDAFADATPDAEPEAEADDPPPTGASKRNRNDYDWHAIKACYMEGRGPKDVAAMMNVPINTLRGRITREGWARQRREA